MRIVIKNQDYKLKYIDEYGKHFSEKLCNFATSMMYVKKQGENVAIQVLSKEQVDDLLSKYDIEIDNCEWWDYVYVANMCKADFYGTSVTTEAGLALFIKDYLDDPDGYCHIAFCRFLTDCELKDIQIDWKNMI